MYHPGDLLLDQFPRPLVCLRVFYLFITDISNRTSECSPHSQRNANRIVLYKIGWSLHIKMGFRSRDHSEFLVRLSSIITNLDLIAFHSYDRGSRCTKPKLKAYRRLLAPTYSSESHIGIVSPVLCLLCLVPLTYKATGDKGALDIPDLEQFDIHCLLHVLAEKLQVRDLQPRGRMIDQLAR